MRTAIAEIGPPRHHRIQKRIVAPIDRQQQLRRRERGQQPTAHQNERYKQQKKGKCLTEHSAHLRMTVPTRRVSSISRSLRWRWVSLSRAISSGVWGFSMSFWFSRIIFLIFFSCMYVTVERTSSL